MLISYWSSDVCSSDLTAGEETTRDRLVVGKDAWRNDDRTVNAQCVADANCDGRIRCRRVAKTAELDVATYRAEEGRIGSILAIADDFSVQPATGVVLVGIIGRVECDDAAAQHFRVIGTVDRRPAAEHAVGVACRYRAAVGQHEIGKEIGRA